MEMAAPEASSPAPPAEACGPSPEADACGWQPESTPRGIAAAAVQGDAAARSIAASEVGGPAESAAAGAPRRIVGFATAAAAACGTARYGESPPATAGAGSVESIMPAAVAVAAAGLFRARSAAPSPAAAFVPSLVPSPDAAGPLPQGSGAATDADSLEAVHGSMIAASVPSLTEEGAAVGGFVQSLVLERNRLHRGQPGHSAQRVARQRFGAAEATSLGYNAAWQLAPGVRKPASRRRSPAAEARDAPPEKRFRGTAAGHRHQGATRGATAAAMALTVPRAISAIMPTPAVGQVAPLPSAADEPMVVRLSPRTMEAVGKKLSAPLKRDDAHSHAHLARLTLKLEISKGAGVPALSVELPDACAIS